MPSRLVLGCGSVGRHLAVDGGSVHVVTADEHRVETLRAEGVSATRDDPADPDALADIDFEPATVVVGSDDPTRNRAVADLAREAFPDAHLFAFAGRAPTEADVTALEAVADTVADPREAVRSFLMERAGDSGLRIRRLKRVLRNAEPPLAIFAHDNPDPDAIASAMALKQIAERAGTPATACYFGDINHRENRALVNLLDIELDARAGDPDLSEFGSIALVDHSRPGVNDQLPPDTDVDIVIDHHPPRAPVEARFVDLRSDVGATSTLLTEYLRKLGTEPTPELATALLFGIAVDTDDFSREVVTDDFEAAAHLVKHADMATLERIESPSVDVETFEILARATAERDVREGVLTTYVSEIRDRDALAQAADQLLGMEDVSTTLVLGRMDGTVFASARARGSALDLGEALREAFDQIGSAGGHADMAGAQIPIGALVEENEESPDAAVREALTDRFYETLGVGSDRPAAPVYEEDTYIGLAEALRRETGDGD
ncbi:DHH family phosphoesterase [Halobacteriales archaeon QS_9_67_17]|nr:MAG: DHH family phosphoesterase [Halobacteriales archaeon QS_9_67_17]